MSRFLVIGEALVDLVETSDGARTVCPGGSPANVALTVARLGGHVELLTWLGEDTFGRTVRSHLTQSGVIVLPQSLGAARTPSALARIDHAGVATYEFDLDWALAPVAVDAGYAAVHTGSIAAVAPTDPPGALVELLARSRATATVTYDPNLRPSIMGTPEAVRSDVTRLVAVADVVKASDEDLAWLCPGEDPSDVIARWVADHDLALGVVTRGADGPLAVLTTGERVEVPAPSVKVIDTVGAGDSFMGALLHALGARGLLGSADRHRLRRLAPDEAASVLQFAARVAAVTVGRAGADPPRLADVG